MRESEFDAVYRTCFEPVRRYALTLTGDEDAAEELTQETFFRALRAIDGFRGECSLQTWLCGIAKHAFLSDARRRRADPLDEVPEPADEAAEPERLAVLREDALAVHRALHGLEEPYKEVFSLRVFGQLSFREIAELFGRTENWACVVFHRAKAKLVRKLEEPK